MGTLWPVFDPNIFNFGVSMITYGIWAIDSQQGHIMIVGDYEGDIKSTEEVIKGAWGVIAGH